METSRPTIAHAHYYRTERRVAPGVDRFWGWSGDAGLIQTRYGRLEKSAIISTT